MPVLSIDNLSGGYGEADILHGVSLEINAGEMIVVPKGEKHRPFAEEECKIMLVEPKDVVNTGNQKNELTAKNDQWV